MMSTSKIGDACAPHFYPRHLLMFVTSRPHLFPACRIPDDILNAGQNMEARRHCRFVDKTRGSVATVQHRRQGLRSDDHAVRSIKESAHRGSRLESVVSLISGRSLLQPPRARPQVLLPDAEADVPRFSGPR